MRTYFKPVGCDGRATSIVVGKAHAQVAGDLSRARRIELNDTNVEFYPGRNNRGTLVPLTVNEGMF